MLTMFAVIGLIVVVGGVGIVLGLAPPADEEQPAVALAKPTEIPTEKTSAFFVAQPSQPRAEVQMEILLSRLEQHVRQERHAVEMFHDEPSAANLRRDTSSPLAN